MLYSKKGETLETYTLGDDLRYYENLKYLPLTPYPSSIQSAMIVYCFKGKAQIHVHDSMHWIMPKELMILFPGQYVGLSVVTQVSIQLLRMQASRRSLTLTLRQQASL